MVKTRTTITLPTMLLQQAKHQAVEDQLNLSQLIERALKKLFVVDYRDIAHAKIKEKKGALRQVANSLSIGFNLKPQQFKKFIENRYEDEMLS